jgi:hypothetical protein
MKHNKQLRQLMNPLLTQGRPETRRMHMDLNLPEILCEIEL